MASNSGNMGGLLVVGAVLVVAAITINAGRRDAEPQEESTPESTATARSEYVSEGSDEMSESTYTHSTVDHADDTNFQQKVLNADGRVLVDFYADWCGPCRMLAPVLDELAREAPHALIVKVNVDHAPKVSAQFNIQSIPALIAFENGQPVDQQVGLANKARLRTMLGL